MTDELKTTTVSANVLDRRKVATHGLSAIVGFFIALFGVAVRPSSSAPDYDLVLLTSAALDRGQQFWSREIAGWRDARVILHDSTIATPCGDADHESGPFYCPADERIYLDLSFLRAIEGEYARAYVIAHELGHHVQKLRAEVDGASVDVELEADCYAGRWLASEIVSQLNSPSIQSAIEEARAVGDDRLCPHCSPEQWTHGSAAMRAHAVTMGLSGRDCTVPR